MIKKTVITTRPDTETPYYEFSLEFTAYRLANYIETGKMSYTTEYSEDGLVKTNVFNFLGPVEMRQYEDDPEIKKEVMNRNQYNRLNGIKVQSRSVENND